MDFDSCGLCYVVFFLFILYLLRLDFFFVFSLFSATVNFDVLKKLNDVNGT